MTDRSDEPRAGLADLPDLASVLYETTQGNALFVTEALHALQEYRASHGVSASLNERMDSGTDGGAEIPSHDAFSERWSDDYRRVLTLRRNQRVQEIILERIERLPATALSVLQISAVINRDFSLELLEAAAPDDPIAGLELLLQRCFLMERPDERLDFSHAVVRQVAYDCMSTLLRRRLHQRVGDALVVLGHAAENPSEAAFHYSRAGRNAQQPYARYSVLAGEKLLNSFGFRPAIERFDDALFVLDAMRNADPDLIHRALQGRGLAYESLLDPDGMAETYQRLQRWARQQGDRQLLLAAYSRLSAMLGLMGQQRESNQLLSELVNVTADDTSGGRGSRHIEANTAEAPQVIGQAFGEDSPVLRDLLLRRQHIYDTAPRAAIPRATVTGAHKHNVWAAFQLPPPIPKDPVAELRQMLDPIHAVVPLFDYGWTLRVQGQLAVAARCLETVVELATETAQRAIASTAYHQLAVIARMSGDVGRSLLLNEKSIALNQQAPGVTAELASMWPRISSAFRALEEGRLDVAERRLRRVVDFLGDRDSFRNHRQGANVGLGLVALERGDLHSARALLADALADTGYLYPYTFVRALLGLARIAHLESDMATSSELLQRALAYAGERSLVEEYSEALLELARLAPANAPVEALIRQMLNDVEQLGVQSGVDALRTISF